MDTTDSNNAASGRIEASAQCICRTLLDGRGSREEKLQMVIEALEHHERAGAKDARAAMRAALGVRR